MAETPIGPLLWTTFNCITEIFILCLTGYILAWKGMLDKNTQSKLNDLNVAIFTPSLLFVEVAFFLSPGKLRELWVIPILLAVITIVSMVAAYILGVLMRLRKSQRSFAIAAAMFMNSNSLPIAIMQSLVVTVPGLKWDANDNVDAMVGRALTYLVLYSTLGTVLEVEDGGEASPLLSLSEVPFPPSSAEDHLSRHETSSLSISFEETQTAVSSGPNPGISVEYHDGRDFKSTFPNSLSTRTAALPVPSSFGATSEYDDHWSGSDDELDDGTGNRVPPGRRPRSGPTTSRWHSCVRRAKRRVRALFKTFRKFMSAPLWAALASLVVACIQPLQHALEEHLPPVKRAIASAGNCAIPVTLVVLGAYFYTPPDPSATPAVERGPQRGPGQTVYEEREGRMRRSMSRVWCDSVRDMFLKKSVKGKRSDASMSLERLVKKRACAGETRTVVVAILARMIVTPLLVLPLIMLSTKFDLREPFDDPVFVVSNVLLVSAPPALTLAQVTQAASGDKFERLLSKTMFWSYCLATPPLTIIFAVIGLILSKR